MPNSSAPKVLIADKMSPKAAEIFATHGVEAEVKTGMTPEELKACIAEYDGVAIRSASKLTEEILDAASNLKVIGRAGIGVDNVDIPAATARGMVVMNTPFGNSVTTAEHAIAMLFAAARKIPQANASTHEGKWEKSKFMGSELAFKTLGLIGAGNIGSIVADRALGLKMRVMAHDPYLTEERAKELHIEKVELDDLLARADFITLHTPLTESTRNILDEKALKKVKQGVIIVNCARGGLIDEEALKAAIESGHVGAAALDVFETEPAKENPLFGLEQVVCTPHLGASTAEAQENVAVQVAEQMAEYLNKGTVINALNLPSLSAEDAAKLEPYTQLGENLGCLAGQLAAKSIQKVSIEYEGYISTLNTKPVSSAILKGLLSPAMASVNNINAPIVAKERNIQVSETTHERPANYQTLLSLTIETDQGPALCLRGTVFSGKPRLVEVTSVKLEAAFGAHMLYIHNEDKPGLIGDLGNVLGQANVNIAHFHLGRGGQDDAIALLEIDQAIDAALLTTITTLPSVKIAYLLSF